MTGPVAALPDRVPAPALFLGAGTSMYYGAALAVGLFPLVGALSVGWARLAVAAVVLLALARPWQLAWTRRSLATAALFGLVLGGMNLLFYLAIDLLPLGAAVAIEFTGPVAVAVLTAAGGWTWRRVLAPLLAAAGVAAISLKELDWDAVGGGSAAGVLLALGAGAAWAGYMVLGRVIAERIPPPAGTGDPPQSNGRPHPLRAGLASLSLGMTTAALAYAVVGLPHAGPLVGDLRTAGLVVVVAVLSSVIPYALDQVALRRLSTSTFALLNALLPATAVLVGLVWLRQVPSWPEVGGVLAISIAITLSPRH